jgi:phenylalanyl-tRNA synthetase beta subunit
MIGDIQRELTAFAGEQLLSIAFLREFPLADGSRSLSYRLTVGAGDRTLSMDEVGAIRSRIIEGMQRAGYELRV